MARLVVKIKYMKPGSSRNVGRYARYIGTREGVQKIDDSNKHKPATQKQERFIAKLIEDHPDCKEMLEYKDYSAKPTCGAASEFIERAMEDYYDDQKTYADYIATRPGSEKIGRHGLFSDDVGEIDLDKVSQELNEFDGIVWTAIVSLRREDAEKLGFDRGERWRNMVRMHREDIARSFHIKSSDLKWYAAFHDESYHPHIHLIVYDKSKAGHLSKQGIENIKSLFAHDIFRDEMYAIQNEKTKVRDELRRVSKEVVDELISKIRLDPNGHVVLNAMMLDLAKRLTDHKGRMYYSYLKQPDKRLVDSIVDEIGKIPAIEQLYELWYQDQERLKSYYNSKSSPRVPLSANPTFKPIRNKVIEVASEWANQLNVARVEDDIEGIDLREPQRTTDANLGISGEAPEKERKEIEASYVAGSVVRLIGNVTSIFRDEFEDDSGGVKSDRKLRRKIQEKDQAHGIKHS